MRAPPHAPHHRAAVLPRLLLALAVLAVTLVVAEFVVRALVPPPSASSSPFHVGGTAGEHDLTVADRDLLYRLEPGTDFLGYYHIGPRGWRGDTAPDPAPAPGVTRIVCVGDSTTFGLGVREDKAWPAVLQRLLDVLFEGDQTFEVINAGVPGYSTWQNRLQIEGELLALQPDAVAWHVSGYNDTSGTRSLSDAEATARNRDPDGGSALWRLLFEREPPEHQGLLQPGWGARRRVSADEVAENVASAVQAVRASERDMVVIVPHHSQAAREMTDELPATAPLVEGVAHAAGARLALPARAFAEHEPFELYVDGVHPDVTGQALLATSVLEALVREPGAVADTPRRAWVAHWLAARADDRPPPGPDGAPPAVLALYDDDPDAGAWRPRGVSADEPDLNGWQALHDPLNGSLASTRSSAAWRLLATRAPPLLGPRGVELDPPNAARLQRHVDRLRSTTVPPDRFTRLLENEDGSLRAHGPAADSVRFARALVVLEHVLGIAPRTRDRRQQYAEDLRAKGKAEDALQTVDGALDLDPADVNALWLRSSLLTALGRNEEARAASRRVVELEPDSALGHSLVGRDALRAGDLAQAETSLRAAIALDPAAVLARYLLGRTLLEAGRLDEAEVQFRTALAFGQAFDIAQLLERIAAERAMQG